MSRKKLRRVTLVSVVVLLPAGVFGFGYFYSNKNIDNKVAQTLTVDGEIGGSIKENITTDAIGIVPGDQVSATIDIKPLSKSDSLLRVKVRPYWMDNEGKEDGGLNTENLKLLEVESVKKDLSDGSWYKEGEYYYYIGKVNNKNDSINLIKGIEFLTENNKIESYQVNDYQNKGIGIEVTMDMVQCSGTAYDVKWNFDKKMTDNLKKALDSHLTQSKKLNNDKTD